MKNWVKPQLRKKAGFKKLMDKKLKEGPKTYSAPIRLFPKPKSFFLFDEMYSSSRLLITPTGLKFFGKSKGDDGFFFDGKNYKEIKKEVIKKVNFNYFFDNAVKLTFGERGKDCVVFIKHWYSLLGYPSKGPEGNQEIYGNIKRMLQGQKINYEKIWFGRFIEAPAWKFALIFLLATVPVVSLLIYLYLQYYDTYTNFLNYLSDKLITYFYDKLI